ncbi:MAG: AsnC family transcriptional regulator [Candidatus Thorarchaeota archaeon]
MKRTATTGRKPLEGLDRTDLDILSALGRLGGKVSTEELAQMPTISKSPRTIRYRLKRLRDEEYLGQLYAQSHEIKLGLGDCILVMQEAPNSRGALSDALKSVPWFYYQGPSYGKYNGYLMHAMYSSDDPDAVRRIADELVSLNLVNDYHCFYVTDYESRRGDFRHFEYNKGWDWDSSRWIRESEDCIASGDVTDIKLDYSPKRIDFDAKDILLIRELKAESNRSLRELGQIVMLSDTQVRRRITRLENEGILKGYRWILKKVEKPLFIYFFMNVTRNTDSILTSFYRMPFPSEIMMESKSSYLIRIRLYGTELIGLLRGITFMRDYLDSHILQIAHDTSESPVVKVDTFFNEDTLSFQFPVDQIIENLRKKFG